MDTILIWFWGFAMGIALAPQFRAVLAWALRPLRCRLQLCPCKIMDTRYGISGCCVDCGKIVGFMSTEKLMDLVRVGDVDRPSPGGR